jgi:hypothetical protein
MRISDIVFILAVGAVAGYQINNHGLDRKAMAALNQGVDNWTRRSAKIMLEEIDFTFPADSKLDALAST